MKMYITLNELLRPGPSKIDTVNAVQPACAQGMRRLRKNLEWDKGYEVVQIPLHLIWEYYPPDADWAMWTLHELGVVTEDQWNRWYNAAGWSGYHGVESVPEEQFEQCRKMLHEFKRPYGDPERTSTRRRSQNR